LGAQLATREQAVATAPDSLCAALYLVRHRVPALGKERLKLRIYAAKQGDSKQRTWRAEGRKTLEKDARIIVQQGGLEFRDLPDRLGVFRDGKEIFRHAGFHAGGHQGTTSHADPTRPLVVETIEGMITKISITSQTSGRQDGALDWQSTYWLFP